MHPHQVRDRYIFAVGRQDDSSCKGGKPIGLKVLNRSWSRNIPEQPAGTGGMHLCFSDRDPFLEKNVTNVFIPAGHICSL
jgi:hypothetical protein